MSQSRMREIEGVVNPLSEMIENMGGGGGVAGMHMNMMGYGGSPSWVEMLVCTAIHSIVYICRASVEMIDVTVCICALDS